MAWKSTYKVVQILYTDRPHIGVFYGNLHMRIWPEPFHLSRVCIAYIAFFSLSRKTKGFVIEKPRGGSSIFCIFFFSRVVGCEGSRPCQAVISLAPLDPFSLFSRCYYYYIPARFPLIK